MDYELLLWDTELLGEKVARVLPPHAEEDRLAALLAELRKSGVRLAYWAATERQDAGRIAALGGRLVDEKTTYAVAFVSLDPALAPAPGNVEPYRPEMEMAELEALAIQSGVCSRFAVDPQFPRTKFEELYRRWIRECVKGTLAREVLVVRENGHVAGMVTVGEQDGRGTIGLIAVGKAYRGKGYGSQLVRAAQQWAREQGYTGALVVTQARNACACRLYERFGYSIEKVEYFYHFWL